MVLTEVGEENIKSRLSPRNLKAVLNDRYWMEPGLRQLIMQIK